MNKHFTVSTSGAVLTYSSYMHPSLDISKNSINENYEIFFIVSGNGILTVEGQSYDISRGALFAISPMKYYSLNLSLDMPYEYYSLHFSKSVLIQEAAEHLSLVFFDDKCRKYSFLSNAEGVFSVFERFSGLSSMNQTDKHLYFKMLISELLILLSAHKEDECNDVERDLGARVIRYLSDNVDADISLDALARRFFVSKYYLCRAFKSRNGISVHNYINKKKVLHAKQLIEDGESASAAAYKVGFGDYSAFYRAYVKHLGVSPTSKRSRDDTIGL